MSSQFNSFVILLMDNKFDEQSLIYKTFWIIFEKIFIEPSPRISILSPFATVTNCLALYFLNEVNKFILPVIWSVAPESNIHLEFFGVKDKLETQIIPEVFLFSCF